MGDSGHAVPQNDFQRTQLNHSKPRVSTNLPRSSSWRVFLRWWKEMQHQQLLSQQWSMGSNAQMCNVTATSYATWTARDAWQTQGEREVQRVGACQTWDFMSHLQPALYHPSHQERMQHIPSSWGLVPTSEGTLCFPWFSQTTYKDPKLDLLTTSWRSHEGLKWMVELKDQHCYQPCCCSERNMISRGQCFLPGLFAGA